MNRSILTQDEKFVENLWNFGFFVENYVNFYDNLIKYRQNNWILKFSPATGTIAYSVDFLSHALGKNLKHQASENQLFEV